MGGAADAAFRRNLQKSEDGLKRSPLSVVARS